MRRVISFILVLALVFSMSGTVFADFVPSKEGGGEYGDDDGGCDHVYEDGVCQKCGKPCDHHYSGDRCTKCGKVRPQGGNGSPKTGDIILFWVAVMLASVAAMGGMAVLYRKKFRR